MRNLLFAAFVGLVGLFAIACQGAQTTPPRAPTRVPQVQALASFTEHDVAVAISFETTEPGKGWLLAKFTPTREGFHLYSKDMPKYGQYGLGRPTLMERMTPQGAVSLGSLVANQPTVGQYNRALNTNLEVYPDGPVELRVLMNFAVKPPPTELAITYMACSIQTCLEPVVDKTVEIEIKD